MDLKDRKYLKNNPDALLKFEDGLLPNLKNPYSGLTLDDVDDDISHVTKTKIRPFAAATNEYLPKDDSFDPTKALALDEKVIEKSDIR